MLKLNEGNVLLKPSQRKQLMSWLKRVVRLGERLGDFMLTITLQRSGKFFEVKAAVHDSAGDFVCRFRQHDWRQALRNMVHRVVTQLHNQCLSRDAIA